MSYPYIVQGNNITIVIGSTPHTISKSHITYQKVLAAIKAQEWDKIADLIEPKKVVINYGKGNVSIQGDKIFWKNQEMHNALSNRMVQMINDDFPVEPLVAFMENLMDNPSKRAVTELYGFLEKNTLPITPDGHFLAYKKVKIDYKDLHSETVLNKPAVYLTQEETAAMPMTSGKENEVTIDVVDGMTVVTMERNLVDDDQNRTCSSGLHFCSRSYLSEFGGDRIVILKINPRDVVSIPNDYNDSKGRTCRYVIVDEIDKDKVDEAFTKSVQATAAREASTVTPQELKALAKVYEELKASKAADVPSV